jgi:hypothetical protein
MIDSAGAQCPHFALRISQQQTGPDPGLCPGGVLSLSLCVLICSSSRKEKKNV